MGYGGNIINAHSKICFNVRLLQCKASCSLFGGCLAYTHVSGKLFTSANDAHMIHFHMQLSPMEVPLFVIFTGEF